MKKLSDIALQSIGANLHCISRVRTFLPNIYKEILLERLASHDKLTKNYLPFVTYNLFADTLKYVNFNHCEQLTDSLLGQLGSSGCKLRYITIHKCINVTDVGICNITTGQEQLECLELRKLSKLTHKGLQNVESPKLHTVDLCECSSLTTEAVNVILRKNASVRILKVARCDKLNEAVYPVIAKSLQGNLEELNAVGLHFTTDENLAVLADHCPNLQSAAFLSCDKITSEGLNQLTSKCPKIHTLDLSFCTTLEKQPHSSSFLLLPQTMKELSIIGVMLMDEQLLVKAMCRLTKMKSLQLCGVPAVTDTTLTEILKEIGGGLELLDLSGGIYSNLTDDGLKAISEFCSNLQDLSLSLLKHTEGATLLPMFKDPDRAEKITKLRLNCRKLDTDVAHTAAKCCHNLTVINVSGLRSIDDFFLFCLAENCPSLSHVNLKGCKQVTDAGVCEMARCCPITIAVLSGLNQLTDRSIIALAHNCPYLEELYISGCSRTSRAAVLHLQDQCIPRVYFQHKIPNAEPGMLMAKNLDTGEYCRVDRS